MPLSQTRGRNDAWLEKIKTKLSSECQQFKDKNLEFIEAKF